MTDPRLYGPDVDHVEVLETGISWVFLAGDRAYKVKRPVRMPFLDYTRLASRRHFCFEELRLNRRLAPDLYLGVRALVRDDDGCAFADADDPDAVEYAVEMKRIPDGTTLADRIRTRDLTRFDVDHVAQRIAGFHAAAPIVAAPAAFRNQLRATLGALASADRTTYVLKLDDALVRAQQRCRSELRERVNRGLVREGHGDLRAEHVVMTEPVQIFDCVEFDPGLREIDVGADLAFLVMDLERLGRPGEARQLVEAYASAGGDPGSPQLRALFAAYRASVRALAAALLVRESRGDARHRAAFERDALIRLAWSFAWRSHRPRVVAVCGPAAVGKTTLAREIAELARLPYLSSDRVRKGLAGVRASERAPADAYDAQMNARVYEQLGRDAARSRHGAVVDATFRFRDDRDSFRHAAGSISPLFVQCAAPPGLAVARARRRVTSRTVESDAGEEQARIQAAEFEPLVEIPRRQWLPVDTTGPVELAAAAVEANLERGDRVRSYAFR